MYRSNTVRTAPSSNNNNINSPKKGDPTINNGLTTSPSGGSTSAASAGPSPISPAPTTQSNLSEAAIAQANAALQSATENLLARYLAYRNSRVPASQLPGMKPHVETLKLKRRAIIEYCLKNASTFGVKALKSAESTTSKMSSSGSMVTSERFDNLQSLFRSLPGAATNIAPSYLNFSTNSSQQNALTFSPSHNINTNATTVGAGGGGGISSMYSQQHKPTLAKNSLNGSGAGQQPAVHRFNPNESIDEGGNTPLHIAAQYNDISLCVYLVLRGANPSLPNFSGVSAIEVARGASFELLEKILLSCVFTAPNLLDPRNDEILNLLSVDRKPSDHNGSGSSVPGSPISPGSVGSGTSSYRNHHANNNNNNNNNIDLPMMFQVATPTDPHLSVVADSAEQEAYTGTLLLRTSGSLATLKLTDTNATTSNNKVWSPLMKAAYRGQHRIAKYLIQTCKVDVTEGDPRGYTALHWACLNGHVEIVELLLNNWANPCALSKTGLTPLHCACWNGYVRVVAVLLGQAGVDPNGGPGLAADLLNISTSNGSGGGYGSSGQSLSNSFNVNGSGPSSTTLKKEDYHSTPAITPLMIAAWRGFPSLVVLLLANGAKLFHDNINNNNNSISGGNRVNSSNSNFNYNTAAVLKGWYKHTLDFLEHGEPSKVITAVQSPYQDDYIDIRCVLDLVANAERAKRDSNPPPPSTNIINTVNNTNVNTANAANNANLSVSTTVQAATTTQLSATSNTLMIPSSRLAQVIKSEASLLGEFPSSTLPNTTYEFTLQRRIAHPFKEGSIAAAGSIAELTRLDQWYEHLLSHNNNNNTNSNIDDDVKQGVISNLKSDLINLVTELPLRGTLLDVHLLNMIRCMGEMLKIFGVTGTNEKHKLAAYSATVAESALEIVRMAERALELLNYPTLFNNNINAVSVEKSNNSGLPGKTKNKASISPTAIALSNCPIYNINNSPVINSNTNPNNILLWSNGQLVGELQKQVLQFRQSRQREFLTRTRIALGVWPPPSAFPDLLEHLNLIIRELGIVTRLVKLCGLYEQGYIKIEFRAGDDDEKGNVVVGAETSEMGGPTSNPSSSPLLRLQQKGGGISNPGTPNSATSSNSPKALLLSTNSNNSNSSSSNNNNNLDYNLYRKNEELQKIRQLEQQPHAIMEEQAVLSAAAAIPISAVIQHSQQQQMLVVDSTTAQLNSANGSSRRESSISRPHSVISSTNSGPNSSLLPAISTATNNNNVPLTASTLNNSNSTVDNQQLESKFYSQIEQIIGQTVKAIQFLKACKDAERKDSYVLAASDVYSKVEMLVNEILQSDVFFNNHNNNNSEGSGVSDSMTMVPRELYAGILNNSSNISSSSSSSGSLNIKELLSQGAHELLQKGEEIIFHARLASGVWPPDRAVPDMLNSTIACLTKIKAYVNGTRGLLQWIWKNMDEERLKRLTWKRECMQSEIAKSLFKVILEDSSSSGSGGSGGGGVVGSSSVPSLPTSGVLSAFTEEELAILNDDDSDGSLILEYHDTTNPAVPIIKGGKLSKLVERLAHHTYIDFEYQSAFLLTHKSFTTSSNLLDMLLFRYDIAPPYGLSERLFTLYVSRKIVPIRLRIANLLRVWVDRHFEDFINNAASSSEKEKDDLYASSNSNSNSNSNSLMMLRTVRLFVEKRLAEDFSSLSVKLVRILDDKLEGYNEHERKRKRRMQLSRIPLEGQPQYIPLPEGYPRPILSKSYFESTAPSSLKDKDSSNLYSLVALSLPNNHNHIFNTLSTGSSSGGKGSFYFNCSLWLNSGALARFLRSNSRNIFELDPLEVARQLTLIDSELFGAITAKECLNQGWNKNGSLKYTLAPNITRLIGQTNYITRWVATSLLEALCNGSNNNNNSNNNSNNASPVGFAGKKGAFVILKWFIQLINHMRSSSVSSSNATTTNMTTTTSGNAAQNQGSSFAQFIAAAAGAGSGVGDEVSGAASINNSGSNISMAGGIDSSLVIPNSTSNPSSPLSPANSNSTSTPSLSPAPLYNFNGLTAIVAGLSMGSVARLSDLWTSFKDKHPKLYESFQEAKTLVSPKGQYSELRRMLRACATGFAASSSSNGGGGGGGGNSGVGVISGVFAANSAAVAGSVPYSYAVTPFLGTYLTDLTFIEDGNPDFLETNQSGNNTKSNSKQPSSSDPSQSSNNNNNSSLINFEKRRKVAYVIKEIQSYQASNYPICPVPPLIDYLREESSLLRVIAEERDLYALSFKIEPRSDDR